MVNNMKKYPSFDRMRELYEELYPDSVSTPKGFTQTYCWLVMIHQKGLKKEFCDTVEKILEHQKDLGRSLTNDEKIDIMKDILREE